MATFNERMHRSTRTFSPAFRKESLIIEMKKMMAMMIYKDTRGRGTLEQERAFFGHVSSPEHMVSHTILADDDLGSLQEGSGAATTDGGAATGSAPPTLTGGSGGGI